MKKWMYVIFPGIGIAVFLGLYFPAKSHFEAVEASRAEAVARQKTADDAHKKELEDLARQDSEKRAAQNAKDEAAREAARLEKWNQQGRDIQAETDAATADGDRYSKQIADLQIQLDTLHKQKDDLSREDFDLTKQVELARVNESTADLEIQRMVEMIANRAGASSMTVQIAPTADQTSGSQKNGAENAFK